MIYNYTGTEIKVYAKSSIDRGSMSEAKPIHLFRSVGKATATATDITEIYDRIPFYDKSMTIKGLPDEFDCYDLLIVTERVKNVAVAIRHPWADRMVTPVYEMINDNKVAVIGLRFN